MDTEPVSSDGADGTDGTDGMDGTTLVDADAEGFLSDEDCDDDDPAAHPDANELCNYIDDNCGDVVGEGVTTTSFLGGDGDGYQELVFANYQDNSGDFEIDSSI